MSFFEGRQVLSRESFGAGSSILRWGQLVPLNASSKNLRCRNQQPRSNILIPDNARPKSANVSGIFSHLVPGNLCRTTRMGRYSSNLQYRLHNRLVYDWTNLTQTPIPSLSSESLSQIYGGTNYTLTWNDVPKSLAYDHGNFTGKISHFFVNLGVVQRRV